MYKYKKKSSRKPDRSPPRTFQRPSDDDIPPLTGWVNGRQASDIEERFARGMRRTGTSFQFQKYFAVLTSLPGEEKVVDFLIMLPIPQTVDVDGEFSHKTAEQKGKDALRDALLNDELLRIGYQVPHLRVPFTDLQTQEDADRTARAIVSGRYS